MYATAFMKSLTRGGASTAFILMLAFLLGFSIILVSGAGDSSSPNNPPSEQTTSSQIIVDGPPPSAEKNLQLRTFQVISTTPVPLPTYHNITSPAVCTPTITTETLLVIDNSGSMDGQNLVESKVAGHYLVDTLSGNPNNRVGLVVFSKTAQVYNSLTSDFAAVKAGIDTIPESSNTCIQCGVQTANQEIALHGLVGLPKSIILLTDGKANHVDGKSTNDSIAVQAAKDVVMGGFTASGTTFYPIGFGKSVNTKFMTEVASLTGGTYYFSPTADALAAIFNEIAKTICSNP